MQGRQKVSRTYFDLSTLEFFQEQGLFHDEHYPYHPLCFWYWSEEYLPRSINQIPVPKPELLFLVGFPGSL